MTSVAIVAGGAGDLGRGVADALVRQGAAVAVLDLQANDSATGSATDSTTLPVPCDLTDPAAVRAAVARVTTELGEVEQLVCAAGVVSRGAVMEMAVDDWSRVLDASLTSAFLMIRETLPSMRRRGGGAIVTLSSGLARKGYPYGAPYASAKAAIEALTRTVALEHARDGIRCNAVAPGPIRSTMTENNPNFDEVRTTATIPLGRLGEVGDVVEPILFLLGRGARYITGQVLQVNGGMLMP